MWSGYISSKWMWLLVVRLESTTRPGSLQLRSTSRCVLRQLERRTRTIFDASLEQIRGTTRSDVRRNGRPFYGKWLRKIFLLLYVAFYVPRCFHSGAVLRWQRGTVSVELQVEFRKPRESRRRSLTCSAQYDYRCDRRVKRKLFSKRPQPVKTTGL